MSLAQYVDIFEVLDSHDFFQLFRALRNHFLRKTPKAQPQLPENEFYEQHQADEDEASPDEKPTRTPEGPSHQAPVDDGIVVLESKRLIREAMERGIDPLIFVTSRINLLKEFPLEKIGNKQSVRLFWLPHQTISGWSDLTTSPGYMGEFKNLNYLSRTMRFVIC